MVGVFASQPVPTTIHVAHRFEGEQDDARKHFDAAEKIAIVDGSQRCATVGAMDGSAEAASPACASQETTGSSRNNTLSTLDGNPVNDSPVPKAVAKSDNTGALNAAWVARAEWAATESLQYSRLPEEVRKALFQTRGLPFAQPATPLESSSLDILSFKLSDCREALRLFGRLPAGEEAQNILISELDLASPAAGPGRVTWLAVLHHFDVAPHTVGGGFPTEGLTLVDLSASFVKLSSSNVPLETEGVAMILGGLKSTWEAIVDQPRTGWMQELKQFESPASPMEGNFHGVRKETETAAEEIELKPDASALLIASEESGDVAESREEQPKKHSEPSTDPFPVPTAALIGQHVIDSLQKTWASMVEPSRDKIEQKRNTGEKGIIF
jgi:hypothetical protein